MDCLNSVSKKCNSVVNEEKKFTATCKDKCNIFVNNAIIGTEGYISVTENINTEVVQKVFMQSFEKDGGGEISNENMENSQHYSRH